MKNKKSSSKKTALKKASKAKAELKESIIKIDSKKTDSKKAIKADSAKLKKVSLTIKELKQANSIKKLAISNFDRKTLSKKEKDCDNIIKYCFDKKYYSKVGANITLSVRDIVKGFNDFGHKVNLEAISYLKDKTLYKFFTSLYNISCSSSKFFKEDYFLRLGQLSNNNGCIALQQKTLNRYNKSSIDSVDVKISITSFTR